MNMDVGPKQPCHLLNHKGSTNCVSETYVVRGSVTGTGTGGRVRRETKGDSRKPLSLTLLREMGVFLCPESLSPGHGTGSVT